MTTPSRSQSPNRYLVAAVDAAALLAELALFVIDGVAKRVRR